MSTSPIVSFSIFSAENWGKSDWQSHTVGLERPAERRTGFVWFKHKLTIMMLAMAIKPGRNYIFVCSEPFLVHWRYPLTGL